MSEERWSPSEPLLPERSGQHAYPVLDMQCERVDSYTYLRAYGRILLKRRWTLFATALAIATVAAAFSYKEKPVYRATAQIEVDSETPGVQSVSSLYQTVPADPTFLPTQADVLNSDRLAWQTIQQLKLDRDTAFNPSASEGRAVSEETSAARQARLIRRFEKCLQVDLVAGSRVIKVNFESTNPQSAARVANTLVSNYREYNFLTKYDATHQASGYMRKQLDDLKAKVEESQEAMVDYERKHSIVNISGKMNIQEQRLADLSQDLTRAQNDLAREESLYQLVKANPAKVSMLAQDNLLQNMEGKCAELKTEYVDALDRYGPKFPKVVRLGNQITEIQSLISQERARTVERISHNYQAGRGRVRLLAGSVAREKAQVGNLNQLMIQHGLLKHEFETNQKLYDSLLARVKDAAVSAGLRANNVHILDHALAPSTPVRPKKGRNIAIGLMVGLILGTTLAFVQEVMDTSIKTADDVERNIAEPVLGVIPSVRSLDCSKSWLSRREGQEGAHNRKVELAVLKHPTSVLAEAYHTLRTAVLHSSGSRSSQTLLLTSAQPFEGKTSTAFNLAIALTQIGRRVLFIDADLRQPGLKRLMKINGQPGLSSVLTGAGTLEQSLLQFPDLPNLWFLPAGPQPANPADLLASKAMAEVMATVRGRFDHVVVDTPPALMVTDATILSSIVDGVILVTESQVTGRAALMRMHRILEDAGANILGCVLNKLDLKYDGHYGSYYCDYIRYYKQGRHRRRLPIRQPVGRSVHPPSTKEV